MDVKVDYPFIYFQGDEKLVFVYEIISKRSIKVEDLLNGSQFRAIEMNESEEFETFMHKDRRTPEGTSFFMNEKDIAKLVDEINRVIQEY